MPVINLLTSEEKSMIGSYIDAYAIPEGASSRTVNVDYILREWDRAKSSSLLSSIFKDSLIYSKPVDYSAPSGDIEKILRHNPEIQKFRNAFESWIESHRFDWDFSTRINLTNLNSIYCLANRVYDGQDIKVPDPSRPGKFINVTNGCKTMKMIGKIYKVYANHIDADYEAYRIAVSQALNISKLSGTLCISIHPLDYMTMSDNECDWDSCMNWRYVGSYRQGTVEMMNSPYVVVAYLTAKDDMKIPNGYWNNKKWRSLYICHPSFIGNVKGYPYQIPELDKIVISILKEKLAANTDYKYQDIFTYDYDNSYSKIAFETGYMYNDFGTLTENYGCFNVNNNVDKTLYIDYSGASECMSCGQLYIEIDNEEELVCENCCNYSRCDECGNLESNLFETGDGNWVCESCLADYYSKSFCDDEYYRTDEMVTIYVLPDCFRNNADKVRLNSSYDIPVFYSNYYHISGLEREYLKENKEIYEVNKTTPWAKDEYYVFYSDMKNDWQDYLNSYLEDMFGYTFERMLTCCASYSFKDTSLEKEFKELYKKELTF